jgi:cobalt transporter subunit CbtA
MLHRILWAALVAGIIGGLATAVLQHFTTTPLILAAEKYENAGPDTAALHAPALNAPVLLVLAHGHSEQAADDDEGWAPADGLERTLYTSVATIGTSFGFALILLSAMILADARITARSGLLWGLAGFAAAGLAPALGLAPELPGSAAADLGARQLWWAGTAVATAGGLWLALRIATPVAIAGGIALMLLPHVIGAPHPQAFTSTAPAELSGHFAAASLVVLAVVWVLAGTLAGWVWQRGEARQAATAATA